MFESLIQLLHHLALNALGLIIALLSGELPVKPPPPSEPPAQRVELSLQAEPQHPAFVRSGRLETQPQRCDAHRPA